MTRRPFALLLAALPVLAGCVNFSHRVGPDGAPWGPADTVPDECKACVHVFLIDCFDPFGAGQLGAVRDYLHGIGFGKTYWGWSHHLKHFRQEMAQVHADRPGARFLIVGFGSGAKAARDLAAFAYTVGIPVESVFFLEPTGIEPPVETEGAASTITLRAVDFHAASADGTFAGRQCRKSELPTHPETLKLIEREATLVAAGIRPPPCPPAPPVFLVPPIPTPRDVPPKPTELPPEWRFLRLRDPWLPPDPPPPGVETLPAPKTVPQLPPPKGLRPGL